MGVRSFSSALDVSDPDAVDALAEQSWAEFGHIDLIVANAGVIQPLGSVLKTRESDARWVFDVNFFGAWHCMQAFGCRFVEQGTPAWILATGSENCVGVPHTHAGFYTASKHALLALWMSCVVKCRRTSVSPYSAPAWSRPT